MASTYVCLHEGEVEGGKGRSAFQRGDGTLHNLMGGCGTYIGGVAVDVAVVERDGAAKDLGTATLR